MLAFRQLLPYRVTAVDWLCLAALVTFGIPVSAAEEPAPDEPARGHFLIASRDLMDPNFAETVVLLVDYSSEGATGVIVNRPTKTRAAKLLPEVEELQEREDKVWLGGPVATWQMVLLARSSERREGTHVVFDDVIFTGSSEVLKRLIADDAEFRVYVGHAGWAPGQLEREIERGGWHILPARIDMVFDSAPHDLWQELIRRTSVQWASLSAKSLDASDHPARK